MLHRSFKPAKCKTSLKLATSRLKLMKNKKLVQINQMKRELSQLLETGQERTARIRVEHVIREEKMVAAYELIEIYCELIAARLPIIESQKSCPIDLKEAVTSVIFASPRCSDITELQDVRKHFTTKYGKEFISGAIELRPDCGVGRMLIEKLSAVAPDVQTKIKVLSAVAAEYNIKWDPKAFEEEESKPPDDLLNGPNTFEKASVHSDPPKYQAAPIVQVPYSHGQGSNEPVNYSQQNSRSSVGTGNYASTDTDGIQSSSSAPLADARASGRDHERMEVRQSFPRDGNDNTYDRQNWNIEFKDATAAAQAAAESAERASMAARAAVELSSQGKTGQPSTNSRKSNYREQEPQRYGASDLPAEHCSRGSYNNSTSDKKPEVQDQQRGRSENEEKAAQRFNENGYGRRSSQAASFKSRNDSIHDDNSVHTEQKTHGYSQESSYQEINVKAEKSTTSSPDTSIREQTRASKVELDNPRYDSFKSDNYGYHREEMNRNQSSTSSSRSHSMNSNDDYNVPGSDRRAEDLAVGVDHENIYKETKKTSMHDYVADDIASDEAESDEDGPRFDKGSHFDEVDTSTWSPKRTMDESVKKSGFETQNFSGRQIFSEQSEHSAKSVKSSEDNLVPAAFDPSDGPVFDEDETDHKKINEQRLDLESSKNEKSRIELTDLLEASPSPRSPMEEEKGLPPQQSLNVNLRDEFQDDAQSPQSSDSESGPGLNLGALPGGFRNKGYKRPPYTKNPSGNALSLSYKSPERSPNVEPTPIPIIKSSISSTASSPNVEPMPTPIIKSSISSSASSPNVKPMPTPIIKSSISSPPIIKSSISSTASKPEHKESSGSQTVSGSDFNYSSFNPTQEETRKSRFEPPPRFFDHDDDDSEDDRPKGNSSSSSRVNLGTGISRRTKAAPSTSVNSAFVTGRKPSRHSYSDETSSEPSKPMPDPKIPRREERLKPQTAEQPSGGPSSSRHEAAKREKKDSKSSKQEESLKSQAAEKPSSPQRKKVDSGDPESEKASNFGGGTSTGEKKASHVHPKLPDYDDIAARLQALRMNR